MAVIKIQPTSDQLIPGQTVSIPIVVVLDSPTKVRGLHATFHGAEETKANYTTYNPATNTPQTQTAVQHHDYVKSEFLLSGNERMGFFGNLADGLATLLGGGEHEVLDPGEYPFEVEVQVPENVPPSFGGSKCRVFYELSVLVDIPAARDAKALHAFEIVDESEAEMPSAGHVRTRYPEDQERGLLDSWFGPDIRVEAALAERVLREGDTLEGFIHVSAPNTRLEYRAISVRLIAVESTEAHGHTDSHTHEGEPHTIATEGVMAGDYSQEFSIPVARPSVMTTTGEKFSIDCYLQIEFDVPRAKDPKIRVPVTLL